MRSLKTLTISLLFLCASLSLRLESQAQIRPVYDQGALGLAQQLKRLNTTASALMIGAHPDDEDTALLTYLARGENARTAYLSLTRGDGGQNLIGPELGEALGVIRTEELLQARRLDGAEQFFTRAYDYGFSKTLAEAKEKWDEKVILCDVVRVIRSYRPLVVISQFSGTSADGHGQHQYAGYISPIAVKAAADAGQCKDSGEAWNVKKFYVRHRGTADPTLRVNTGKFDQILGRSYFEIAMEARSQHRSQEQGVLELKGSQFSSLDLVGGASAGAEKEQGIFDGLNTSVSGQPTVEEFDLLKPEALVPKLLSGLPASQEALLRAVGLQLDVLADRETVVPGEEFSVSVRMFTPSLVPVKVTAVDFNFPYIAIQSQEQQATTQGPVRREAANFAGQFKLTVPTDAAPTQPYWLLAPRQGDLFSIPVGMGPSLPFSMPDAYAKVSLEVGDKKFTIRRPLEYRYADDIRGEIRRELNVVPKVSVELDQNLLIVSRSAQSQRRTVTVTIESNSVSPVRGTVNLNLPDGWVARSDNSNFELKTRGQKTGTKFTIEIPANTRAGSYDLAASATVGGDRFSTSMVTLAYPHIQTHRIYREAQARVTVFDLAVAPVRVGYIAGSGDRVAEALRQMGISVENIDDAFLANGDFSKFDTVVVGIRAYQVREDLVANNQRLMDFVNRGGTLIVQYQLPQTYAQQNLAPFPTQMGPRVSDENASVTISEPSHPIFNSPNKITADDFEGWVQERNLYNFVQMDPKYTGLLESHDAGEAENKGGLVIAAIGKGKYVYCSYSLFRQLPAGVPGAYRLLANLVGLPKTKSVNK
jgi:LmbE family N-acetylglucosaminyl deacetylase